jgi:enamine deaminase RidA (YjgF/YER057c/UK114 family)
MSLSLPRRRFLSACGYVGGGVALGALAPRWLAGLAQKASAGAAEDGPEARLKALKIELPKPPVLKGATLVSAVRAGDMLYVSGHTPGPGEDGKPIVGKLGKDFTVKQGQEAARRIALIVLAVVRNELGSLDRVVRVVKTLGMVNCTPDFTQQPQVVNGFSNLLAQVFGDKAGKGARSAVGMASLPGGAPVEVEIIFQVKV